MFKKLIYLVSFVFVLGIAVSAQATPIPVSVDPSVESVIGDDGIVPPNKALNTYDLQVKNFTQGRRVTLISYDMSGLKKDYQMFANMKLSILGGNTSGKVDVYGVIEDQDNISGGLKWNNAPGVNNGQPIGYPVDLDEADLSDKLLSFTSPGRDERKSAGSAALDDFINSDTDGVVTLLLAPAGKGVNALMKSSKYSDGGVILEGEITTGMDIIFVSFHGADDAPSDGAAGAGLTEAADKAYTDLLNADAHNVTRYITSSSPDPNVLNVADLVIISRSVSSGGYSNDGATAWNGITAPMIITGGYVLRNSRMGYTTGGTMVDTTGDITLTVNDPTHPIFAGIALTDGTTDNPFAGVVTYPNDPNILARGISINNSPVNAYGTVLAIVSEASADTGPVGGMVIGEWPAGAIMTHSGGAGTDILAGQRLVFLTGSREADGVNSETAGLYDLSADGAQMFLNAVVYMTQPIEPKAAGELLVDVSAADPSAGTETWVNNGTLGDFSFMTLDALAVHPDTKAMTPGAPPAVEEFEGVPVVNVMSSSDNLVAYTGPISVPGIEGDSDRSIEAWVADINDIPSSQAIIAWGSRSGDGQSCCFSYGTRNTFGALIHYGDDYDMPWGNNFDAPKDADGNRVPGDEVPTLGTLHHLVYTYEGTTVNLYVDGQLVVTRELGGPLLTIAGLPINLFVQNYRVDGGFHNNSLPASLLVNSIRVHDGVLNQGQVLNNYNVGPSQ